MSRPFIEPRRNGHAVAGAERHLTNLQLVDFVIGASSPAAALSARRHLAACPQCREYLANLRDVDRELEHGGGRHRLQGIPCPSPPPSPAPAPVRGQEWVAGAWAAIRSWQRLAVPLMPAVCAAFVLSMMVEREEPPIQSRGAIVPRPTTEMAEPLLHPRGATDAVFPEGSGWPMLSYNEGAHWFFTEYETAPAVVEGSTDAVAPMERFEKPVGTSRRTRQEDIGSREREASRPTYKTAPEPGSVKPTWQVERERHPGADRVDDRVSPPPRGV